MKSPLYNLNKWMAANLKTTIFHLECFVRFCLPGACRVFARDLKLLVYSEPFVC